MTKCISSILLINSLFTANNWLLKVPHNIEVLSVSFRYVKQDRFKQKKKRIGPHRGLSMPKATRSKSFQVLLVMNIVVAFTLEAFLLEYESQKTALGNVIQNNKAIYFQVS